MIENKSWRAPPHQWRHSSINFSSMGEKGKSFSKSVGFPFLFCPTFSIVIIKCRKMRAEKKEKLLSNQNHFRLNKLRKAEEIFQFFPLLEFIASIPDTRRLNAEENIEKKYYCYYVKLADIKWLNTIRTVTLSDAFVLVDDMRFPWKLFCGTMNHYALRISKGHPQFDRRPVTVMD